LPLEPAARREPTPLFLIIFHLLGERQEKSDYRPLACGAPKFGKCSVTAPPVCRFRGGSCSGNRVTRHAVASRPTTNSRCSATPSAPVKQRPGGSKRAKPTIQAEPCVPRFGPDEPAKHDLRIALPRRPKVLRTRTVALPVPTLIGRAPGSSLSWPAIFCHFARLSSGTSEG
jgi:hypothetical protein